ncbi:hypothetical protein SpCBS45565_g00249 [Spizellomyces sp. 'palustris']|nr:hypothetical protein SpCBS45565_g00249 [Spizellomyces sp. 'palustris']
MATARQPTITLHPLSSYTFGVKDPQPEEDPSVAARLLRLQSEYQTQGMRITVEGVLVVHEHGHPHVLMLQIANTFFKLPGDALKPGEDEVEGLKARLNHKLAPPGGEQPGSGDWEVGELLAVWWRPNFETFMVCLHAACSLLRKEANTFDILLPPVPIHTGAYYEMYQKPKEMKKVYLVHLPDKSFFGTGSSGASTSSQAASGANPGTTTTSAQPPVWGASPSPSPFASRPATQTGGFGGFGMPAAQPATSASGFPGGAPAASAAAPSSFFSAPATQSSGLGGFGTSATTQPTTTTSSFLSAPPSQSGGLAGFGMSTAAQPAATSSSSLFSVPTPQSGGLGGFGTSTPAQTAVPAASSNFLSTPTAQAGGLGGFGGTTAAQPASTIPNIGAGASTSTASSLFSKPAAQTGGLPGFGSSKIQPTASTAPSNTASATVPASTLAASSLFIKPATQTGPAGLGTATPQRPAVFATSIPGSGGATAAPGSAAASSSLFPTSKAATAAPPASVTPAPALGASLAASGTDSSAPARVSINAVTLKTKYFELPPEFKQLVDGLENIIQQNIRIAESNAASQTADSISEITEEVKQLSQKLAGLHNLLQRDRYLIDDLRQQVGLELRHSDLIQRFVERYRSGSSSFVAPPKHDPHAQYFIKFADNLEKRMQQYRQIIEELELNIKSLSQERQYSPQVLLDIMRNQDDSFMAIASKIAMIHDALDKQKENYADFRRRYFGIEEAFKSRRGPHGQGREATPLELIASTTLKPSAQASQGAQAAGLGYATLGSSSLFGQPVAANPTTLGISALGASNIGQPATSQAAGSFTLGSSLFAPSATTNAAQGSSTLASSNTWAPSAGPTGQASGSLFGGLSQTPTTTNTTKIPATGTTPTSFWGQAAADLDQSGAKKRTRNSGLTINTRA